MKYFFQTERDIRAGTFQFDLSDTTDIMFPANADPVLNVIYKLRGLSPAQEAASLQPQHVEVARSSPGSSAASNSDSGIGYRDEALHPQVGCFQSLMLQSLVSLLIVSIHTGKSF